MVLEPNAFHPGRSGRNHLRILADGAGIGAKRIEEMLGSVSLAHAADRHVGGYSLGMRQRLGLAAALLGDPPVLVLDEPGNGLDPQGIRWLRDLLRERAAGGGTVFVSSHILAEVENLADEIVVLSHGQLVTTGTLGALQQAGTSVRTEAAQPLTQLLTAAGATVHTGTEGELVVRGIGIAEIGDRACAAGRCDRCFRHRHGRQQGVRRTAADQRSLMAFASNAVIATSLFGAIAVAREYGHHTVVPMFLTSPDRTRAVLAQLVVVLMSGAVLALIGQAVVVLGIALALPSTGYGFLVSAGDLVRIFAATTLAGAIGATLGAGLGALIRNIGGSVTTAVLVLFVIPPLAVQAFTETASWIPQSLLAVISGVSPDMSLWAALLAIGVWAVVPAAAGLVAGQRRDVV